MTEQENITMHILNDSTDIYVLVVRLFPMIEDFKLTTIQLHSFVLYIYIT